MPSFIRSGNESGPTYNISPPRPERAVYLVAPPRIELESGRFQRPAMTTFAREPLTKKGRFWHLPFNSAYETKMSKTRALYWASGTVRPCAGGEGGSRTRYILLAKQTLYRMSYNPTISTKSPSQSKYR